jgi:hypothetical protein
MWLNSTQLDEFLVLSVCIRRVDSFPVARVWRPHHKQMHLFKGRIFLQSQVGLVSGCNTFLFLVLQRHHVGVVPITKLDPFL